MAQLRHRQNPEHFKKISIQCILYKRDNQQTTDTKSTLTQVKNPRNMNSFYSIIGKTNRTSSGKKVLNVFNVKSMSTVTSSTAASPIIELREYEIAPQYVAPYTQATSDASTLRKELLPMRLFSLPETGGKLNVATHMYYFEGGYEERNQRRKNMGTNKEWNAYLSSVRPFMMNQKSTIFVEAPLVANMEGICGLKPGNIEAFLQKSGTNESVDSSIIELRRYQLKLGYDTVPNFLELYGRGLPSKLNAPGTDPTTMLVTILYSEVGQLNEVIEVWRHGSTSAMERSRVAARAATEWKRSIADIAGLANIFTNTIHKPVSFSPLK